MNSIEVPIFDRVYQAVRSEYPDCAIYNDRPQSIAKFPAVSVIEQDNTTYTRARDIEQTEAYSEIMYQIDVFADNQAGGKTLCKKIAAIVDSVFVGLRFTRMSFSPMPNTEPNVIRYTGRYRAVVSRPVNEGTDSQGLPELNYYLYRR